MSAYPYGFDWNAIDFGDPANYGVVVIKDNLPKLPTPRVPIKELANTDGAATQGSSFGPLRIRLKCALVATDASDRDTKIENCRVQLKKSQALGEQPLIFGWATGSRYMARLVSEFNPEVALTGAFFDLEWIVSQPWPEGASPSTLGPLTIDADPDSYSKTPGGTEKTDATWIVKNGATEASSVTLTNTTDGRSVFWNNTLSANEWLRLNSQTQKIETSTDSGANWTQQNQNTIGLVPRLVGGEANSISIAGIQGADGTLEASYTTRG